MKNYTTVQFVKISKEVLKAMIDVLEPEEVGAVIKAIYERLWENKVPDFQNCNARVQGLYNILLQDITKTAKPKKEKKEKRKKATVKVKNYDKWLTEQAEEYRKCPTNAEQRAKTYFETKAPDIPMRFQVPIKTKSGKGYIADFLFYDNIILEVDGASHNGNENILKDKERTNNLEKSGYQVIRMTNGQTKREDILGGVATEIKIKHYQRTS